MVKKCGRKGSPEVIPSNHLLKSWLTSGVTLSRWGPRPVEFWKSPRMEILQPLWASSSLWFFFFLQYAVKISLLLHVVAFTACPFTMQTTRLWITCPYPMFLVKKEKKKNQKNRTNSSDLSPIQKLHDLQKGIYPQEGRIPAQSMYGIKLIPSEKLAKSDKLYQLSVCQYIA